jgi:hypothetical protein
VHEAVCGSLLGCEYGGAEGVGEAEAIDSEDETDWQGISTHWQGIWTHEAVYMGAEEAVYDMVVNTRVCIVVHGMRACRG